MKRFKSYGFWTAFAGALTLLLNSLGRCFGFAVDNEVISDVIMAFAGLLVAIGVVTMPKGEEKKVDDNKDNLEENKDNLTENDEKTVKNDEKTEEKQVTEENSNNSERK